MKSDTAQQLRDVCEEIRRKPYPIKDLIPLLQKAADELDSYKSDYDWVLQHGQRLYE